MFSRGFWGINTPGNSADLCGMVSPKLLCQIFCSMLSPLHFTLLSSRPNTYGAFLLRARFRHVFPNRWLTPQHTTTPTTGRAREPAAVSLALRCFGGSKGIASVLPIPGTPSREVRGGEGSRMDPWPGERWLFLKKSGKKKAIIIWTDFTYTYTFFFNLYTDLFVHCRFSMY